MRFIVDSSSSDVSLHKVAISLISSSGDDGGFFDSDVGVINLSLRRERLSVIYWSSVLSPVAPVAE